MRRGERGGQWERKCSRTCCERRGGGEGRRHWSARSGGVGLARVAAGGRSKALQPSHRGGSWLGVESKSQCLLL